MALTATDKKEIERIARDEVKKFLNSTTLKQFEEKIIDLIVKEIKRGKAEKEIKELVVKMMREFYQVMWVQRSVWEPRLKNV
jgi:hypothetical protein